MKLSGKKYAYQNRLKRTIVGTADFLGSLFFRYPRNDQAVYRRILVIRTDSIGDVVICDAFLSRLKEENPDASVIFLTTPAGKKIYSRRTAQYGGPIDELRSFDCKWFSKKSYRLFSDLMHLKKIIRSVKADRIIDLRGDVRNILAARMASPESFIESFGITGGRFLLNQIHEYPETGHAVERNFVFLKKKYAPSEISLSPDLASEPFAFSYSETGKPDRLRIAVHPGAGTNAKKWSPVRWSALAEMVLKRSRYELFWFGDVSCLQILEEIKSDLRVKGVAAEFKLNQIPLESLGFVLADFDLLISADSGPVHIAAAQKLPTIVLFSGTSLPDEWTPWKNKSQIIRKPVSCSPCYRTACNQPRHDCMLDIKPEEVFDVIEDMTMDIF